MSTVPVHLFPRNACSTIASRNEDPLSSAARNPACSGALWWWVAESAAVHCEVKRRRQHRLRLGGGRRAPAFSMQKCGQPAGNRGDHREVFVLRVPITQLHTGIGPGWETTGAVSAPVCSR